MQIEHLRTFLEIAATGSFRRAAERLHVTQSTVSARIRALEERLDRRLFVRERGAIQLTAAGQRLRRHADLAVRAWEQGRQHVGLPDSLRTVFGLGVQVSMWEWLVPPWVERMRADAPDVALHIEADYSDALMRRLDDGLLDLAVLFAPRSGAGRAIELVMDEEVILVATDRRAAVPEWRPDYVFVDWSHDFRVAHAAAFPAMDTPAVTVGLPAMALALILRQGGAAYLSRYVAAPHLAAGRLHEVSDAPSFRRFAYMVQPEAPRDPDLQTHAAALVRRIIAETARPAG
ncbi:MAG: LysR family transcriptional regulator [Geminicoccaceae bacterium]|nr:LysR family transcriptional regulator [Geminicoccaceae bacterium]